MGKVGDLYIENAKIVNRDFSGEKARERGFGDDNRSFSVEIEDKELFEKLSRDGLSVWTSNFAHEGEDPRTYLNVKVNFNGIPPKIVMIAADGSSIKLTRTNVRELDKAWIKHAELYLNFNEWNRGGVIGVTAYCDTLVVELLSPEERAKMAEEYAERTNPVIAKYGNSVFGDR